LYISAQWCAICEAARVPEQTQPSKIAPSAGFRLPFFRPEGTALKKCYFPDYRFSEDLDFTLAEEVPFETIREDLDRAFERSYRDLAKINKHVDRRIEEGAAMATINGELRYLRRMLRLSCKLGKLAAAPIIELLPNENRRDDYVEATDFAQLLTKFHDADVRDLVEFQYASGWRVGSIMRLEKKDIDWQRETVKLRDAISKNKQPALLSFKKFPAMRSVLLRRKEKLRLNCPFIFHRNGRRIKDFRDE
jgi:integrase